MIISEWIINKWKETEAQKKQEEPKLWKPKYGEDYFYICLCYHHEGKRWSVESWLFFESQGFVWFDTFENAEKAAEILNKELEESK